ncbi:MAG TPA: hypothetical protein PKY99_12170, partial [Turneriella sp.]|nr:hypothetical protein [Turneriella sp.]
MTKTAIQAFACLSFSFIIACSGGAKITQGNDAAASVYKPNDLTSASAQISADKGGYINVGKAQLRIPAQALETDTTISAEIVDMQLPAGEAKAVGKGIRLLPEGLQFLKPADLMLCYSATEMANLNAQDTKIYYQVSGTQYAAVAGTVDMNTNCVSSHIEHFSSYVAAAQALAQTSLAPTAAVATTLPGTPMTGIPLYLRAIITPRSGASIATAYVNYRVKGSGSGYTKVALQPDSTDDTVANRYFFAIPASEVASAGIEFEYYFDATDNLNKSVRSPGGTAVATTIPAVATTGLR